MVGWLFGCYLILVGGHQQSRLLTLRLSSKNEALHHTLADRDNDVDNDDGDSDDDNGDDNDDDNDDDNEDDLQSIITLLFTQRRNFAPSLPAGSLLPHS